jgi:hypothetical protein
MNKNLPNKFSKELVELINKSLCADFTADDACLVCIQIAAGSMALGSKGSPLIFEEIIETAREAFNLIKSEVL